MITHVIFDFDGTLVNTIDVVIHLLKELIKSKGAEMNQKVLEYIPNLETFEKLAELINSELKLSFDVPSFKSTLFNILIENKHLFKVCPGVDNFLKHLKANNIPMAVATGNLKRYNDMICSNFPGYFEGFVEHILCGMDDARVKNKKPHPDIYLVAAEQFRNPPASMENVLIFEDSITGLKGAIASGAKTVLVTQMDFQIKPEHASLVAQTVQYIRSFEEFRPESLGLPAYAKE